MIRPQHIATACLLLALLFAAVPRVAAPSHEDPDAPLAVRPDDESRRLQAEAAGLYQGARTASIGFALKSPCGIQFAPGATKDGKQQPAPSFKILDASGKVLKSDKFSYG